MDNSDLQDHVYKEYWSNTMRLAERQSDYCKLIKNKLHIKITNVQNKQDSSYDLCITPIEFCVHNSKVAKAQTGCTALPRAVTGVEAYKR